MSKDDIFNKLQQELIDDIEEKAIEKKLRENIKHEKLTSEEWNTMLKVIKIYTKLIEEKLEVK